MTVSHCLTLISNAIDIVLSLRIELLIELLLPKSNILLLQLLTLIQYLLHKAIIKLVLVREI